MQLLLPSPPAAGVLGGKLHTGGIYYPTMPGASTSTGLSTTGRNLATPFYVPNPITLAAIGAEVTGAGDAGRTVADGVTTDTSPVITSATAAFVATDVGRKVTGTGIPANTYILTRDSATQVTLTKNATATGVAVSITISGCVVRLGIYFDDGFGFPGALLLDAGTIDGNSATVQDVAISQALAPGDYWATSCAQGVTTTAPTMRVHANGDVSARLALTVSGSIPGANTLNTMYQQTAVTGALPNPFTTTPGLGTLPHRLHVKVT